MNTTTTPAPAGPAQPVAAKLQARSAAISVHSSNHATVANAGFAWR
jgi:hypothetical protein